MTQPHFHTDEAGLLVRCYHRTRNLLTDGGFWIGVTISYPLEHFLWEQTPLKFVLELLHLSH